MSPSKTTGLWAVTVITSRNNKLFTCVDEGKGEINNTTWNG